MNLLHLCADRNFISTAKKIFDIFYPGKNTFIVDSKTDKLKVIKDSEGMLTFNLWEKKSYKKIEKIFVEKKIDNVILHGLHPRDLSLLLYLKTKYHFSIYWLFWGYELYETIGYEKKYKLIDQPFNPLKITSYITINSISKYLRKFRGSYRYRPKYFIKLFSIIDYFCFWNIFDFQLLQKYYPSKMKYKYFAYGANFKETEKEYLLPFKKIPSKKILINHQASLFGNHDTIFKRLSHLDSNNSFIKIVPLSYGSTILRKEVLKVGKKLFGSKFKPILTILPKEEYFSLIGDVDVAIFGQNRQEASGNIIQLLKNGVKIFLRNNNSLLQYYKSRGYIIFSFEDDLTSISDLEPLSIEDRIHNRNTAQNNKIYYEDFMPLLFSN